MTTGKTNVSRALAVVATLFLCIPRSNLFGAEADQDVPAVIEAGLKAYSKQGGDAAVTAWFKGGPMEGEKRDESAADTLRRTERFIGKFKSYEVIATKEIGRSSKIVYLALNYDRGALFTR